MSSPLGESGTKLAEKSGTGNWIDGIRFTSRSSEEDVQKWAKGLDLTKPINSNKTLITYLSYPLSDGTDADVFEIQPAESYGNDFNKVADRALAESY